MSEAIPHWLTKQAGLSAAESAIELPDGKVITFSDLSAFSMEYAKKLATVGVRDGTHVGILSANCLEMAYVIHALSYLGAVGVLLNTRLTDKELEFQLEDAEVDVLIVDEEQSVRKLQVDKSFTYDEIQNHPAMPNLVLKQELDLDAPFTIMYTSGTTGLPKGVVHTYGNYWWSAIASALNLGLDKEDKWLISLPLFHVSGMSTLLKSVIYGMPIYLMRKFDEGLVHEAIMHKQVTIVSVVTLMLQRLTDRLGEERYPDHLRCFLLGGGPAPKVLLEKAKTKGIPVFQSYGMTETTSQIATLSPKDALEYIGSAGQALLPAWIKIDDPGPDGVGEIVVKGPMVTKGYYKNENANKEAFQDGWLHTGDLGYLDEKGYLYVVDRRNDLIISGGENIYPSEIENALLKIPAIKEAGVTRMEDEIWGYVPVAYVVLQSPISEKEIIEHLKEHLAKYKIPKKITVVDQLPRNAANKLMRNKLKGL